MSVYIENEYDGEITVDNYIQLIESVIGEAADYVNCPYECEVNVTITDNVNIHKINLAQRNIDNPTDVLSFPMIEYKIPGDMSSLEDDMSCFNPDSGELMLGDIVISYDKVISQAAEYGHSQKRELAFLTAHSMLHLFGYDHMIDEERIQMEKMQEEILANLNIKRDK